MDSDSNFDIFKRLPNGDPLWITTVRGLKEAKETMALEAASSPGEYFIFLRRKGIVANLATASEEWADVVGTRIFLGTDIKLKSLSLFIRHKSSPSHLLRSPHSAYH